MAFKVYTKTGDKGLTSLFGGARVPKHHIRIESYGTLDELNSFIGSVVDQARSLELKVDPLSLVQHQLFSLGAQLATDPSKSLSVPSVKSQHIDKLEEWIDSMEADLEPLKNFILPAGHPLVSQTHIARSVCRRAERLITALNEIEPIDPLIIAYVNRLSDALFVLARHFAHQLKVEEVIWSSEE